MVLVYNGDAGICGDSDIVDLWSGTGNGHDGWRYLWWWWWWCGYDGVER